ncbi:hypothetical protein GF1_16550 [Desulfolithobacter dissulfuricans]|uniref:Uncharacterized protein n=2 Tax=Desulfolithobacter dissulfuricans TaxID=2795293 RepID=A0A915U1C6_9BACT|nr:hypothetical protein GF1_16550 [Desulfolithobacter dissulfuricans]
MPEEAPVMPNDTVSSLQGPDSSQGADYGANGSIIPEAQPVEQANVIPQEGGLATHVPEQPTGSTPEPEPAEHQVQAVEDTQATVSFQEPGQPAEPVTTPAGNPMMDTSPVDMPNSQPAQAPQQTVEESQEPQPVEQPNVATQDDGQAQDVSSEPGGLQDKTSGEEGSQGSAMSGETPNQEQQAPVKKSKSSSSKMDDLMADILTQDDQQATESRQDALPSEEPQTKLPS